MIPFRLYLRFDDNTKRTRTIGLDKLVDANVLNEIIARNQVLVGEQFDDVLKGARPIATGVGITYEIQGNAAHRTRIADLERAWRNVLYREGMVAGDTITYTAMSGVSCLKVVGDKERFQYLNASEARNETHFVAIMDNQIVGIRAIEQSPYAENELWVKFIAVDPRYRFMGIARELVKQTAEYAASANKTLVGSSLTDMGTKFLARYRRPSTEIAA